MKFSARTEYACLAMLQLAADQADAGPADCAPSTLRSLSERQAIPDGFLVQILQDLRKAGLVTSTRGSCGGYRLARPAADISLADVRRAIEGQQPDSEPPTENPLAASLRLVCDDLHRAEHRRLGELSLAKIVDQAAAPTEPMWYI
ncbi:MAG: Rrf2 family transcriptional regulator [Planctomycetota bacterium]